jgi:SnoaL-like domain
MEHLVQELMKRNLYEVFGERNAALRRQRIAELWTEDCTFVDNAGEHSGWDALDAAVATVQEHTPEFVFTEVGKAQAHHGIGRIAWGYGPKDKPSDVTGLDVAVIRDTRIQSMYTFLDER